MVGERWKSELVVRVAVSTVCHKIIGAFLAAMRAGVYADVAHWPALPGSYFASPIPPNTQDIS